MLDPTKLAGVADFSVGIAHIKPSTREVQVGDAVVVIEPLVMQLLVVLANARGAVVSRDNLIEQCWGGRAISEDALNRAIAKVRLVGSGTARGSFQIETVVKVGYRLLEQEPLHADSETRPDRFAPVRNRLRFAGWLAAMVIVAIAGGFGLFLKHPAEKPKLVAKSPVVAAAADLETRGLSAIFEGTPGRTEEGIGYLRQAVEADPGRASLWGSLAMAYVLSLPQVAPSDQATTIARVREAVARAQALDPTEGRSLAASVSLIPTFRNWDAKGSAIDQALKLAPPMTAPLMFQQVQFLAYTGRTSEALAVVEKLNRFSPLIPWIQSARANLLAANDRPDEAQTVAEDASRMWPRERLTWFTRFYLYAYQGLPDRALAMAADRAAWPTNGDPREIGLAILTARALRSRSVRDADSVIARLTKLAPYSPALGEQAVRTATALGRPTDALRFATILYTGPSRSGQRGLLLPEIGVYGRDERNTAPLFSPPAITLWQQPGFMPLMRDLGLVAYWNKTTMPDMCFRPTVAPCLDGAHESKNF